MSKKSTSGRVDFPQMVAIGVVIVVLGLFLANSTFLAIGTSITPPRTVSEFCYDTDSGQFPYDAGVVAVVALDSPIQTRLSNAQLIGYITSLSVVDDSGLPAKYKITFQPPGVTGNPISGMLTLDFDLGTGATTADESVTSETTSTVPDSQDDQAVLTEKYCVGNSIIGQKLFVGTDYTTVPVPLVYHFLSIGGTASGNVAELI
ncbi:MAG: hypothetical protein IPJ89_03780 [Candidatus Iainarchaeum archaeon]|uniref:Uncharacterized protein n=1 Tax=Candidatus Iainarchaeum sp. TaxID=3101447 RepID=A0A7T9DJ28_9ARCH|nr:MAG: hypothetical protein IPJ89_03780 [Candidatus Diapherotrites archaeon]